MTDRRHYRSERLTGLTVEGRRPLVAVVPHGDAAVVAGRDAVLAVHRAAAGGRLGGLGGRRRQRRRGKPGGGRRGRRGSRRHLSHYRFTGDVVSPGGLFLTEDRIHSDCLKVQTEMPTENVLHVKVVWSVCRLPRSALPVIAGDVE